MKYVAGILLLAASTHSLCGQRYSLSEGTVLEASETTLRNGVLVHVAQVDGGGGVVERTFKLEEVVRLDWPEPGGLGEARRLLAAREPSAALLVLEPILKQFAPFAKIAGSWWPTIARLRLQVLQESGVVAKIEQAARELAALSTEPEAVGEAKLALTELEVRAGRARLAEAMLESILSDPVPAAVRARAWLLRGDIAMADKRYEAAVEAYLRIPVFHGAYDHLVPAALLAGERAFRAWGDVAQAERLAGERARREVPVETGSAITAVPPPESL